MPWIDIENDSDKAIESTLHMAMVCWNIGALPEKESLIARDEMLNMIRQEVSEITTEKGYPGYFINCPESRAGLCRSKEFCEGAPYRGVRSTEQNFLRAAKDKREQEHVYEISGLCCI